LSCSNTPTYSNNEAEYGSIGDSLGQLKVFQDSLNSYEAQLIDYERTVLEKVYLDSSVANSNRLLNILILDSISISNAIDTLNRNFKQPDVKKVKHVEEKNTKKKKKLSAKEQAGLAIDTSLKKILITKKTRQDIINQDLKVKRNEISNQERNRKSFQEALDNNFKTVKAKRDTIQRLASRLKGAISFKFKGKEYLGFITKRQEHTVSMHWLSENNINAKPFYTFDALLKNLRKPNLDVLMITNAGMYSPEFEPQGLFISEWNKNIGLDTSKPYNAGNFYLQPNGVFSIDFEGRCFIDTTDSFKNKAAYKQFSNREKGIKYATQSGPMLVINGKINREFNKNSPNAKIRSGVGLVSDERVVFLCSVDNENFWNFSNIFLDIFKCKNALFLDGAISKMYLKEFPRDVSGSFGPMISVIKSKKGPSNKTKK